MFMIKELIHGKVYGVEIYSHQKFLCSGIYLGKNKKNPIKMHILALKLKNGEKSKNLEDFLMGRFSDYKFEKGRLKILNFTKIKNLKNLEKEYLYGIIKKYNL